MRAMKKRVIFIVLGFVAAVLLAAGVYSVFFRRPWENVSPALDIVGEEVEEVEEVLSVEEAGAPTIVLMATGDVILARSVNTRIHKHQDFTWPFLHVADTLSSADITLINLESPLIEDCPLTDEGFVFCGDSGNVRGLVVSGIDVANLANNHLGNYGLPGVEETKEVLSENGIDYSGSDEQPLYKEVEGVRFAFLGYDDIGPRSPGVKFADEDAIVEEIREASENADVVVVSFHWGYEYVSEPNERQRTLAHLAIDSGADLIVGNHAHWEQEEEWYKGKYIKYAHGNFVFDQMWSEETKKGVIGVYTFEGDGLVDIDFVPVYIRDYGQPVIVDSAKD
jgi:poly-gamma-glutamate capsule biosynthesis protein CapA/YwtB (metallophosphatase superfamily)